MIKRQRDQVLAMDFSFCLILAIGCLTPSIHGQETAWGALGNSRQSNSHTNTSKSVDANVVTVGIKNSRPLCDAQDDVGCSVGVKILAAFEADELLTVTEVETGELICENLDSADEASSLKFDLSANEVVTAERKSFHEYSGDAFSDRIKRKVWVGEIIENSDFDGVPRTISMTWSGCDLETFMLKVITPTEEGTFTTVSVPCNPRGETSELCVLKIHRENEDETDEDLILDEREYEAGGKNDDDDPVRERRLEASRQKHDEVSEMPGVSRARRATRWQRNHRTRKHLANEVEQRIATAKLEDPGIEAKDEDIRLMKEYLSTSPLQEEEFHERGVRRLNEDEVSMPSGRILQATTTVDVMVLYTEKAKFSLGSEDGTVRTSAQMETDIIAAYEGANNALVDSGIDMKLRVVHVQQIDYEEGEDIADAVYELYRGDREDLQVHELRDRYGADLVQLIGFYPDTCGIGFTMRVPTSGFADFGYSVVHVSCLSNFSHIHEIGHNLGANHDSDNSGQSHTFAYGFRYCDGSNPYRTIMAYSSGCPLAPRVNVFSTPLKTYAGKVQGTTFADNARVLNEAMSTVSNFREAISLPDITIQATTAPSQQPTPKPAPKPTPAPILELTPEPMTAKPMPRPTPESSMNSGGASNLALSDVGSIYPGKVHAKRMKRKGCFKDDAHDRVMREGTEMPEISGVTSGMVRDNCMAYCDNKNKGYMYFGVESGMECFCWWDNKGYQRLGALGSEECNIECEGDSETTCGGYKALEVFEMKKLDYKDNISFPTYQGCYRESIPHLEMSSIPVVDFFYTSHEVCYKHCDIAGFAYFGLEFGFLCSCGNMLPSSSLTVADEQCSMPCTSPATTRTCGGNWSMAVFAVGTEGDREEETDDSFRESDWSGRDQSEDDEYQATVAPPFEDQTSAPGKWRGVGAEDSVRTIRQGSSSDSQS